MDGHVRIELLDLNGIVRKHGIRDLVEELGHEVHGDVFAELLVDPGRPVDGEEKQHAHPVNANGHLARDEGPANRELDH